MLNTKVREYYVVRIMCNKIHTEPAITNCSPHSPQDLFIIYDSCEDSADCN